jgi:hypothetical protein
LNPSPCVLSEKKLSLGTIAVGSSFERIMSLKNTGSAFTVFNVMQCPPSCKVSPSHAFLEAGESIDLTVTVSPYQAETIDSTLFLDVRGDKPVRLGIAYEAIIPDVRLLQDEMDFGEVTTGISKTLPLVLENKSRIAATLYLDMSAFPDFDLIYQSADTGDSDDALSRATTANPNGAPEDVGAAAASAALMVPQINKISSSEARKHSRGAQAMLMAAGFFPPGMTSAGSMGVGSLPGTPLPGGFGSASPFSDRDRLSVGRSPSQSEVGEEEDDLAYRLVVPPNGRLEAQLMYAPTHPADYSMEFPV